MSQTRPGSDHHLLHSYLTWQLSVIQVEASHSCSTNSLGSSRLCVDTNYEWLLASCKEWIFNMMKMLQYYWILTDESLSYGATLKTKDSSTDRRLDCRGAWRNGDLLNTIRSETWDHDEASSTSRAASVGGKGTNTEWVRRCGGWLLELDGAVSSLSSDAVGVGLSLEQLSSSKVVTLHISRNSSEELGAVSRSP